MLKRMASDPKTKGPGRAPDLSRQMLVWWVFSLLLLIWYVFSLRSHPSAKAPIPYSVFLAQVQSDNVARVHIAGDTIDGDFLKPLVWPPAQAAGKSEPSAKLASPSPAAVSPPGESSPHREFSTTFPATVGDRDLMPELIAHHVTVDVSSSATPWFVEIMFTWGPLILLVGFLWWMSNRASRSQSGIIAGT